MTIATALKPVTIRPDAAASDAFAQVLDGGRGMLVVVNRGRVVGTVTDAALRRAALDDPTLSMPVGELMSRHPVTAPPSASKAELARVLRLHRLRSVPVVDAGKLVDVVSLDDVGAAGDPTPMAVLMVGGRGERLRPLTDKLPKPLLRIGGSSILERTIVMLAAAGVTEVYLTLGYMADVFEEQIGDGKRLGVRITYIREDKPLGTAGALSLLPALDRPIYVGNGDLVTTVDLRAMFDYHWHQGSAITIAGVEHWTHVPYGVLRTAGHHVLGIDEKPNRRDFVSAGMYVLAPEVLRLVPQGMPYLMTDLLDAVVAEGQPVNVFPIINPERWIDIGSREDFERVLLQFATGEEE